MLRESGGFHSTLSVINIVGHLIAGEATVRELVMSRIPGFYQKLLRSSSSETAMMAELAARDARTVLAGNLAYVGSMSKLDMEVATARAVREALPKLPEQERWRTGLLDILLRQRADLEKEGKETKTVCAMISSLCAT